jgi:hypothetical protein
MHNTFSEVPFDSIKEMILKQLHNKSPVVRIRALMVLHFLIQNSNPQLTTWFPSTSVQLDSHKSLELVQIFISYHNYIKTKTRLSSSLAFSLNPSNIQSLQSNPSDLLHKIEELQNILQALLAVKKPLKPLNQTKDKMNFTSEIATRLFIDSKEIYMGLKALMNALWTTYNNFEAFSASQAEGLFLKYNKMIRSLKGFIRLWAEEYPGDIPTLQLLSEDCIREVHRVVRGKENLNTGVNLLAFSEVNKDGSPVKQRHSVVPNGTGNVVHEKRNSCPESSMVFSSMNFMQNVPNGAMQSVPMQSMPMQPLQQVPMMNNFQYYGMYPNMQPNPMFFYSYMPK